ncbi:hypothetical protein D3C87_2020500 [compost metagenome]
MVVTVFVPSILTDTPGSGPLPSVTFPRIGFLASEELVSVLDFIITVLFTITKVSG